MRLQRELQQVAQTSSELNQLANQLTQVVGRFKTSMSNKSTEQYKTWIISPV